ncbi:frizzled-2-like [Hydractinia symbiolongicarpus]|uniref:frizzled-2-like n=1 Tax=Hydractinia symbiolongicarpus TaxID=13093 RepID=UPI00254E08EB|nr:frizzled-2-like [Hydractinia symbiolongicarpus]
MEIIFTKLFFFVIVLLATVDLSHAGQKTTCVSLKHRGLRLCQNLGYNATMFPNSLEHRNMEDASTELDNFLPLVKIQCAKEIEFFLCSVYLPVCLESGPLPPCREVCERAQRGCIKLMTQYGFPWPEYLRCSRFPKKVENRLCVDKPFKEPGTNGNNGINTGGIPVNPFHNTTHASYDDYRCPAKQQKETKHYKFMGTEKCASLCTPIYFTHKEKDFARNWVLFWSVVCMLSTAFTLLTFIVDMPRFRYPERPIIFLSGCYFIVAIAFISGPVSDNAIACHKTDDGTQLLNQGTDNASCTIVFMLIYFFLMSASIWWVILTLTWFLAAGLKWGHEAIEGSSQYFHAAAWAIPAAKTIAVLAMNQIDGDILAGVCFVGGKNVNALRGFVLAPLVVYLVVGSFFLFAGFISLIQIRKVLKDDSSLRAEKLTRLMVRIGIFSILYSLPAIIVIACLFYEQTYRIEWDSSWISAWLTMLGKCDEKVCFEFSGKSRPDFAVFMIKYLMLLMVGITSGFWIWSGKTIQSWRRFYYNKILHQRVPRQYYESKDGSVFTARTNLT